MNALETVAAVIKPNGQWHPETMSTMNVQLDARVHILGRNPGAIALEYMNLAVLGAEYLKSNPDQLAQQEFSARLARDLEQFRIVVGPLPDGTDRTAVNAAIRVITERIRVLRKAPA